MSGTCCKAQRPAKDTPARAGVIVIENNRLLVVSRTRNGEHFYCIPGGHIETDETAHDAAVRELEEETTLKNIILKSKPIFEFENQGRYETYFVAQSWSGTPQLSGEEADRNCSENSYALTWLDRATIAQTVFYPNKLWELILKHNLLQ